MRGQNAKRFLVLVALVAVGAGLTGCYASRFVEDNLIPDNRALQPVAAPIFFPAFLIGSAVDVALSPVYAFRNEKDGRNIPNYWDYTLENSLVHGQPMYRDLGD